jgi:hypothetical protein
MNVKKMRRAQDAAKEFLRAIDAIDSRAERDKEFQRMVGIVGYRETGAARRASMELTRALADLRKPG